jgi:hypothetical protein
MKPDYCPVCHMDRNDDHPRDGTYKCWCHECDRCFKTLPQDADFVCDDCKKKENR